MKIKKNKKIIQNYILFMQLFFYIIKIKNKVFKIAKYFPLNNIFLIFNNII